MRTGLIAKKIGMTSRFMKEDGQMVPCTVLQVPTNLVLETKKYETKNACLVGACFSEKAEKRAKKPRLGYFKKLGVTFCDEVREFRISEDGILPSSTSLGAGHFALGQLIDVCSERAKGKGFSGEIKRHNFRSQRASHGVSKTHNHAGSTGQCQDPGKVFRGKKMAGQYGSGRKTIQNLQVLEIDLEASVILVKGAVPGPNAGIVYVRDAVKFEGRQPVQLPVIKSEEGATA